MDEPNLIDENVPAPEPRTARGAGNDGPLLPMAVREALPQREPDALAAFFDAYFDRVYGYIRRLIRDEHLAEDLTQDVFLHIHRAFASYDPTRALRPWVFTIATNKLRDHWRSRRHRDASSEQSVEHDGGTLELSGPERPEDALVATEFDQRVRAAIDELPDGMRMTVILRAYEGLSFEAIGALMDRSEVAVRKRYSRALESLRTSLGPAWKVHSRGGP